MFSEECIAVVPGSIRDKLTEHYQYRTTAAKGVIAEFQTALTNDPIHAVKWADKVFVAAGELEAASAVLSMLKHYTEMDEIVDSLQATVLNKARYVNGKSTSVSSNFMQDNVLAAFVEAFETVRSRAQPALRS